MERLSVRNEIPYKPHSTQSSARSRRSKSPVGSALSSRPKYWSFVDIGRRVDTEEEFGDRQEKHDSEEYSEALSVVVVRPNIFLCLRNMR